MTKIIVCGGRVGRNLSKRRVYAVLDARASDWNDEIVIVEGEAAWVDKWAGEWARDRGHRAIRVPVDGSKDGYKPNAPFNRNKRMRDENLDADECLGFPGGGGTFNMMSICHDAGIPVGDVILNDDGSWEIKWWPQK